MKKLIFSMALSSCLFLSCKDSGTKLENPTYAGADISASILRDAGTKDAYLYIETGGDWSLYGGPSVDKIDLTKPIEKGNGPGRYPVSAPDSIRYYFQLVTHAGAAILAEQHLPLEGGYNFRDMGGIRTADGRYTKWGKIFRSDDLQNLSSKDLHYLASIPLITIVDFRSAQEIEQAPDKLPSSVKNHVAYSITPGNLSATSIADFKNITAEQTNSLMMEMNKAFVTDPESIEQYKKFFALLQQESNIPLLFHCSAGKDRTGMAAALFLISLGVDEDAIIEDYVTSNTYLGNKYIAYIKEEPNLQSLFEVRPEFLKAGLDKVKAEHGSVINYLQEVLNVDIEKMKAIYLY
ncbi:MAG: tyrosine-protein phosphatase [Candidatus Azobacteroides sp.]|nr:tyrosine-protein phosphatase [Candidatus Azobacteroides sp.]